MYFQYLNVATGSIYKNLEILHVFSYLRIQVRLISAMVLHEWYQCSEVQEINKLHVQI